MGGAIDLGSLKCRRLGRKGQCDQIVQIDRCLHISRQAEEDVAQRRVLRRLAPDPAIEERGDGPHAVVDRPTPLAVRFDSDALAALPAQVEFAQT